MSCCPVCSKDLSSLDFQGQLVHANSCLDEAEKASQAIEKLIENPVNACPVCLKKIQFTVSHLKTCAKTHGILPRDLVSLIDKYMRGNGGKECLNMTKNLMKKRAPRTPKASKTKTGGTKQLVVKRAKTQNIPSSAETQASSEVQILDDNCTVGASTSSFFKPLKSPTQLVAVNGVLVRHTALTREELDTRVDKIFKHSIVLNCLDSSQPQSDLPLMFRMASLKYDNGTEGNFVAKGFQKYIMRRTAGKENSQMPHVRISSPKGFFNGSQDVPMKMSIDDSNSFLKKMRSLINNSFESDMTIRLKDGLEYNCHSLIWKLNTENHNLLKDSSSEPFKSCQFVDCTDFHNDAVVSFIRYCYTGRLVLNRSVYDDFKRLIDRFRCPDLCEKLLNT